MSETIRELISEEDVAAKVKEIGAQITKDYEGKAVCSLPVNWQKELKCR